MKSVIENWTYFEHNLNMLGTLFVTQMAGLKKDHTRDSKKGSYSRFLEIGSHAEF